MASVSEAKQAVGGVRLRGPPPGQDYTLYAVVR